MKPTAWHLLLYCFIFLFWCSLAIFLLFCRFIVPSPTWRSACTKYIYRLSTYWTRCNTWLADRTTPTVWDVAFVGETADNNTTTLIPATWFFFRMHCPQQPTRSQRDNCLFALTANPAFFLQLGSCLCVCCIRSAFRHFVLITPEILD